MRNTPETKRKEKEDGEKCGETIGEVNKEKQETSETSSGEELK